MMVSNLAFKILEFIKKKLSEYSPELDYSFMDINTDLIEIGIDSIILFTLITEVEKEFSIKITLDQLEANSFIITPISLSKSK